MQIEHLVKMLPVDANTKAELEKLQAEGWEIVPNVPPVAIYHLARLKKPESFADLGIKAEMKIDESKVLILRGGKLYNADGVVCDVHGDPILPSSESIN